MLVVVVVVVHVLATRRKNMVDLLLEDGRSVCTVVDPVVLDAAAVAAIEIIILESRSLPIESSVRRLRMCGVWWRKSPLECA